MFYFSPPPFNGDAYTQSGLEGEVMFRLNSKWRLGGHYSYLHTDTQSTFERGLYGKYACSVLVAYRPLPSHAFTLAYYGNSAISGHSYDRYDFVYNYSRNIGKNLFRTQLIWNHHINGVDGIRSSDPIQLNEGYFARLDQLFLSLELTF